MEQLIPILVAVVALVLLAFGVFALLARFYRQVDQGRRPSSSNTLKSEPLVTFTGAIVYRSSTAPR
nr:hypothetical protein [Deltaproteobacteria bacterium]